MTVSLRKTQHFYLVLSIELIFVSSDNLIVSKNLETSLPRGDVPLYQLSTLYHTFLRGTSRPWELLNIFCKIPKYIPRSKLYCDCGTPWKTRSPKSEWAQELLSLSLFTSALQSCLKSFWIELSKERSVRWEPLSRHCESYVVTNWIRPTQRECAYRMI